MDKIGDIKRIWRDRFNDSRAWMTEVFPRVYRDDEALTVVAEDNHVVSHLLLRPYSLGYLDDALSVGYIYGAATDRRHQGQGLMSGLVVHTLRTARERGMAAVLLQPARRSLYGYYSRFGFATTFFIDEQRYTARHTFAHDNSLFTVDTHASDTFELAAAYRRLTASRPSNIIHSDEDFRTILIDNDIDDGMVAVVRDADNREIAALAFAVSTPDTISVRELAARDAEAEAAALASFSGRAPGRMTVVEAYPEGKQLNLETRGMARIVSVKAMLEAMLRARPQLSARIRIHDHLIADNDGLFTVTPGGITFLPSPELPAAHSMDLTTPDYGLHANSSDTGDYDLDVTVEVFARIAFSTSPIGDIFNLPTARPFMSLMLS